MRGLKSTLRRGLGTAAVVVSVVALGAPAAQADANGWDQAPGWDAQSGWDQKGWDQNGWDQNGWDQNGWDQNGWD